MAENLPTFLTNANRVLAMNEYQESEQELDQGYSPQTKDVICGSRGMKDSKINHPGNERFRLIIEMKAPQFSSAETRTSKNQIIRQVIDMVRQSGGRFIRHENGTWYDIGNMRAREKAGHALRLACSKQDLPLGSVSSKKRRLSTATSSTSGSFNSTSNSAGQPDFGNIALPGAATTAADSARNRAMDEKYSYASNKMIHEQQAPEQISQQERLLPNDMAMASEKMREPLLYQPDYTYGQAYRNRQVRPKMHVDDAFKPHHTTFSTFDSGFSSLINFEGTKCAGTELPSSQWAQLDPESTRRNIEPLESKISFNSSFSKEKQDTSLYESTFLQQSMQDYSSQSEWKGFSENNFDQSISQQINAQPAIKTYEISHSGFDTAVSQQRGNESNQYETEEESCFSALNFSFDSGVDD